MVGSGGGPLSDVATCIPLVDAVRDEDGAAMIVNPLTALAMFDIVKKDEAKAFIVSAGSDSSKQPGVSAPGVAGWSATK